jgi:ribosomal RNA-processing protein 12
MIRKYGYDEIERYVPEDDKKLVSSIRKRQARSKKKKLAQMEIEEENDDEEVSLDQPLLLVRCTLTLFFLG